MAPPAYDCVVGDSPKRSKFDVRREATRKSLLALGYERFPQKGYSATSIQDILRDSGHGRGGFYFHFQGKEEFFLAVLRDRDQMRGAWWEVAGDPSLTTFADVVVATYARLSDVVPAMHVWGLLVAEFWQAVKDDDAYGERIRAYYAQWHSELVLFCEELAARGMLRTDISVADCAAILHATIDGHSVHHLVHGIDTPGLVDTIERLVGSWPDESSR